MCSSTLEGAHSANDSLLEHGESLGITKPEKLPSPSARQSPDHELGQSSADCDLTILPAFLPTNERLEGREGKDTEGRRPSEGVGCVCWCAALHGGAVLVSACGVVALAGCHPRRKIRRWRHARRSMGRCEIQAGMHTCFRSRGTCFQSGSASNNLSVVMERGERGSQLTSGLGSCTACCAALNVSSRLLMQRRHRHQFLSLSSPFHNLSQPHRTPPPPHPCKHVGDKAWPGLLE